MTAWGSSVLTSRTSDRTALRALADLTHFESAAVGDVIFRQSDTDADKLYIIIQGEVTVSAASEQEIPLEADSARGEQRLDWFVDGVHVGVTHADERLWWTPAPGSHEVLVQDQAGRSDRLRFAVRGG